MVVDARRVLEVLRGEEGGDAASHASAAEDIYKSATSDAGNEASPIAEDGYDCHAYGFHVSDHDKYGSFHPFEDGNEGSVV